ncbi:cytochrome P450 94A1-like [Cryptomeria japonica]|uniref:cytochrome P450 94A1-like n=1 Tax=Cryptomeria japonica TaxID=3369 RepID=UPI0027DA46CD|nr:cytochrome P450 94A1-like [Cryptomeria japonica]
MKSFAPLSLDMLNLLSFPPFALIVGYIIYLLISKRDDSTVPASYPIVVSLFAFLKNRSRLSGWLTELLEHAPSNTITFHRPGIKVVITADPGNVEHILKTRFENYPKGNYFRLLLHDLLGTGIFNADGAPWKLQRRVASYEFSTNSLRDFIAESVHSEITNRLLPLLRKSAVTNQEGESRLDMQDVFKRFAFDNVCHVAFGMDPACLDISLPLSEFAEAFDVATNLSLKRFMDPLLYLWMLKRIFNVGSEKRLRRAVHFIHSFAQDIIEARRKDVSPSQGSRRQDLLSTFLLLHESAIAAAEKASYDVFLRDIVISFILAEKTGINVITADPGNVKHLLKTRFENYHKGNYFRLLLNDLLGTGTFNTDGAPWKLQRRVASYEFSTNSLRDFIAESVHSEITNRLLPRLRKVAATNQRGENRLDMQDVFKRFAFDNICQVAFGMDPACLDISLPLSEFAEAFDVATNLSLKRFTDPLPYLWMLKRFFNVGLRQAIHFIHNFAQDIIEARKKEVSPSQGSWRQDLLSRFLLLHESAVAAAGKASYDVFLRDIVISFILAGRDTPSSALTWFFWLLSSHPRIEKNIYVEITRIIAAREENSYCFSYEELKKMQYLQGALCESMRLYPPVPSDTKQALQDDVLPDGTVVRKGMRVIYHPYAMGRMKSIWGTDCLEFKPERWLSKTEKGSEVFVAHNAFKYPVFQAGPRVCLGKEMAFIQMKSIAANIIEEFSLEVDREWNPRYVAMITAKMENGLPVRVVKRRNPTP